MPVRRQGYCQISEKAGILPRIKNPRTRPKLSHSPEYCDSRPRPLFRSKISREFSKISREFYDFRDSVKISDLAMCDSRNTPFG